MQHSVSSETSNSFPDIQLMYHPYYLDDRKGI